MMQPEKEIPIHLRPYAVQQDASFYTPIDHASWRFILKISQKFFGQHAHQKYLDGLRETGISTERIPLIPEIDRCLSKFGWRAVAVSGFIPPAVFMEFLSLGILPIACDMRKLENLAYTPAPDIVHEAAGHAPIIADPEYAAYLHNYGEISRKAIFSKEDLDVYHAVRNLSDVKEDPASTPGQIAKAQALLDCANASVAYVSEATQLARMSWWTIEYGLVGSEREPKIYGAGLLSSVAESYHCLGPEVKKLPFSLDCIRMPYDITRPQPQLYVAPDFGTLTRALDDLANLMAFRQGGDAGLEKARAARTVTTTVLDSGLQVSGILSAYKKTPGGAPSYLQFQGPTQLSYAGHEIEGQGPEYHRQGFGTPIGPLREEKPLSPGQRETLEFASGVRVEGKFEKIVQRDGKDLILSFSDCKVSLGDEILFDPAWGSFDMACGEKVVSVFGGAADRKAYLEATGSDWQEPSKPKTNLTDANRELNGLYARIRELRESKAPQMREELPGIWSQLESRYRDDWLLPLEILELSVREKLQLPIEQAIRTRLVALSRESPEKKELIQRGMETL